MPNSTYHSQQSKEKKSELRIILVPVCFIWWKMNRTPGQSLQFVVDYRFHTISIRDKGSERNNSIL